MQDRHSCLSLQLPRTPEHRLPQAEIKFDMRRVTRWSRFDNRFQGVLFTEVMKPVTPEPGACFAIVRGEHGFTANLPLPIS